MKHPQHNKRSTPEIRALESEQLLPTRTKRSGQELIHRGQTHARVGDQCAHLQTVRSELAKRRRPLSQVDAETSDENAREQTGEQLSDVDDGHHGQEECAGTLSKGFETEKDDDVQKSAEHTGDQCRYTEIEGQLNGNDGQERIRVR